MCPSEETNCQDNIQYIYWRGKNYSCWMKLISFESEDVMEQLLQPAEDQQQMSGETRGEYGLQDLVWVWQIRQSHYLNSTLCCLQQRHLSKCLWTLTVLQDWICRPVLAAFTLWRKQVMLCAGYEHINPVMWSPQGVRLHQPVIQPGPDVITCSAHDLNTFTVIKHQWCHRVRYYCQCFTTRASRAADVYSALRSVSQATGRLVWSSLIGGSLQINSEEPRVRTCVGTAGVF